MPPTPSSDEAYRQAGVDLQRADAAVEIAKEAVASTTRASGNKSALGSFGGFASAFQIPPGYKQPVLLTSCDGVGTKLRLAIESGIHYPVGVDLVAMSVNDLLASGGEPLVFLDYYATGRIETAVFQEILDGIAEGCQQADCDLVGGETAEMPGCYPIGDYDLAGFCVGVVEKDNVYPKKERMKAGDKLIGISSSGFHSNGYSLVRKILFQDNHLRFNERPEGFNRPLIDALLAPTRIYVKPILKLLKALPHAVKGMVHVTGGGFQGNIPRILPEGLSAEINTGAWELPPVMKLVQQLGGLDTPTMLNTFNGGIGFLLVVGEAHEAEVLRFLEENDLHCAPCSVAKDKHADYELLQDIHPKTYACNLGHLVTTPGRCEVILK